MTIAIVVLMLLAAPVIGAVIGWRMPPRAWMGQFAACPGLVLSPLFALAGEAVAIGAVIIGTAAGIL